MIEVASPARKLFVGIKVPLTLAHQLADFPRTRLIYDEGIRWSDPNDLHITLKFIGSVTTTTATQLIGKLRTTYSPRLEACILGADIFQDAGVLVVDVHNSPELLLLQATVAEALGIDRRWQNDRVYRPHITLAHWNATATSQQSIHDLMRTQLDEYCSALPVKSFPVREIVLYETVSGHYRIVEEFRLAG
ncbi:MAG: RNA 2',3'-cyclic phosphodiesterase [Terracidiphilus sp.]